MTDQPLVNWGSVKPGTTENVGGPRGYQGGEVNQRFAWNCPSCGESNENRALHEGCEHCHAGEGASKHVGVDPRPKRVLSTVRTSSTSTGTSSEVQSAFLAWMQQAGTDVGPLAAFKAGWDARGGGDVVDGDAPTTLPAVVSDPPALTQDDPAEAGAGGSPDPVEVWDPAFARSRTLLAALLFFQERMMSEGPEESVSGEWLTAEGLAEWIAERKGPYA